MIRKYVKKPIPIEAIKVRDIMGLIKMDIHDLRTFTGTEWLDEALNGGKLQLYPVSEKAQVETLEGTMNATFDDYLIRGVRGELYICEGSIFEETYEEAK